MSVRGVNKLSIIGAGAVGSSLVYASLVQEVARHAVLHDINAAKVWAEALDLTHGSRFMPQARVKGSEGPKIIQGSDVVVATAGVKQKPGETRVDLATSAMNLMRKVIPPLVERLPEVIFLMVTSPVDVTTYAALKISGLPRSQLFDPDTVLDSSWLRYLVAEACGITVMNVHAYIADGHGDSRILLWNAATIGGIPLLGWEHQAGGLDGSIRDSIADQAVNTVYEVIAGKSATDYAIGLAATRIIESVLRDERRMLPVSGLVEDWYGIEDVCLSVPTVVDHQGAGHTLGQPLTGGELGCMRKSADAIRYTLNSLGS